jgi:hypothetical protein
MINKIVDETKNDPHHSTPRQLKRKLQLNVSRKTIRRKLDDNGLFGRIERKEYPLSPTHIRKRLSFANGYSKWTKKDWERVLFTDETIEEIDSSYYQRWVQRPSGEAFNPKYISNKQAHPPKTNAWACFSAIGAGSVELFNVNLDSKLLKQILDKHVVQQAISMWPSGQWWYLHDNDPKHSKSKIISDFLHNKGIAAIDFPPYSPDLNPIENLWSIIKKKVDDRNPQSVEEMSAMFKEEWGKNDEEMKQLRLNLAHSMPQRCQNVIANKGHKIDY